MDVIARIEAIGDEGVMNLELSRSRGIILETRRLSDKSLELVELPEALRQSYGNATELIEMLQNPLVNGKDGAGEFIRAIIDEVPASPGFDEGYEVQRIVDASVESDKKATSIRLCDIE